MSINVKKHTKDQMAKMVEDAQAEVQELKRVNAALAEQISQMNGEAITRENVIANLKADADVLRNKLADTEAALGRANDECVFKQEVLNVMRNRRYNAEQRAHKGVEHKIRRILIRRQTGIVRSFYDGAHDRFGYFLGYDLIKCLRKLQCLLGRGSRDGNVEKLS